MYRWVRAESLGDLQRLLCSTIGLVEYFVEVVGVINMDFIGIDSNDRALGRGIRQRSVQHMESETYRIAYGALAA
jgi:hypothetical protein